MNVPPSLLPLVDDGIMSWDTPAIELYPDFKVKDPALTEQITMRNLVCACPPVEAFA